MAKRSKKRSRSADHWQRIIEQCARSGMSQAAFCRQQKISLSTFQYWKYVRLKEAMRSDDQSPEEENASPAFVPVHVAPPGRETQTIAVVLTNGRRIEIPADLDADVLTNLVAALEAVPC